MLVNCLSDKRWPPIYILSSNLKVFFVRHLPYPVLKPFPFLNTLQNNPIHALKQGDLAFLLNEKRFVTKWLTYVKALGRGRLSINLLETKIEERNEDKERLKSRMQNWSKKIDQFNLNA